MRVEVLCVGHRPPAWVAAASADYAKRLARHLPLEFRYLAPGHDRATAASRRREEAQRLRKALTPATHVIALDQRGEHGSSADLAVWLARWCEQHAHLTLVIGGADGLDASVLDAAGMRWSLSQLTLPHRLVQVVVAEQLYRAWSINAGHPYHRA